MRLPRRSDSARLDLFLDAIPDAIVFHIQVVLCLKVQPKPLRGPEVASQSQRRVCRDGPRAVHDLVDPAGRNIDVLGKAILTDPQGRQELFEQKGVTEGGLRVFVVGGGCSGYQYGMALAREFDDEDLVVEHSGIKLIVDPDSAPLLEGAEIDYVDDLMKAGFTIYNPNAVKSCACGTSFQTAEGGGQARACSH